jgi:hypothetical protein
MATCGVLISSSVCNAALPESLWLTRYLISKGCSPVEIDRCRTKFLDDLKDEEFKQQLAEVLRKTGNLPKPLDDDDWLATSSAFALLTLTKYPDLRTLAIPHLRSESAAVRYGAAEALAVDGSDAAVAMLEDLCREHIASYVAENNMEPERRSSPFSMDLVFRLLAFVDTPKAKEALDRCRNNAVKAAESRGSEERERMIKKIAFIEADVAATKETPIPDRRTSDLSQKGAETGNTAVKATNALPTTQATSWRHSNITFTLGFLLLLLGGAYALLRRKS